MHSHAIYSPEAWKVLRTCAIVPCTPFICSFCCTSTDLALENSKINVFVELYNAFQCFSRLFTFCSSLQKLEKAGDV